MVKMRVFIFCTILLFVLSVAIFGQKYQRSFYVEDRFNGEVKISEKVLDALQKDEKVKDCINNSKGSTFSSNWFRGKKINLNNDKYPDLIVEPIGGCLRSPMRPPYWILLNTGSKYKVVLSVNTFSLYINKEQTENHFNITTDWSTANTHYKTTFGFNGEHYTEIASVEKPNN